MSGAGQGGAGHPGDHAGAGHGGAPAGAGDAMIARRPRPGLWILGLLAAATFWIPLWSPFLPIVALVTAGLPATRRTADRSSLWVAGAGGGAGLVLFLLLEYVWVV
jgi:hypothetical protein